MKARREREENATLAEYQRGEQQGAVERETAVELLPSLAGTASGLTATLESLPNESRFFHFDYMFPGVKAAAGHCASVKTHGFGDVANLLDRFSCNLGEFGRTIQDEKVPNVWDKRVDCTAKHLRACYDAGRCLCDGDGKAIKTGRRISRMSLWRCSSRRA